ncbi:phosphoribosylamine--glycine ligase [Roseomonas indoligenes]|uniref:Phosphoribosylamine--glycine ligase n=1 Tax=Roseomonas indoligenes TaxID=2820811 RepID=A0A940S515_9PROT|nr:phosphoribosylamine--glycine ligase [Pararoseomonas indoligenes]MBP0493916.1 phosphoribosylamine--glycine ligase [Pararoseomonas indoligenes]
MTRALLLAPLLVLAACRANDPLPPPASAAEVACRKEAQDSPAVDKGFERLQTQNPTQSQRVMSDIGFAEREAYLRCLRLKGLAAPGGVQPVRPPQ